MRVDARSTTDRPSRTCSLNNGSRGTLSRLTLFMTSLGSLQEIEVVPARRLDAPQPRRASGRSADWPDATPG
jgi:hypothetical protein